jgi:two-component system chemotaxis response regulator CheY
VLITSQSDADQAHRASQMQNVVMLSKPFDSAKLSWALHQTDAVRIQKSTPAEQRSPASLRVLVADDSSTARIQIRSVLTGLGVGHIVEVQDGAEARACLEKESYDLVVTDYNMPRLDGRGLIDFIRRHSSNPDVPVILVTTETDPAKLDAVRQLGVSAMCDKSFKLEVVHAVMEKLR